MVHQYKNNGYNMVLDVASGSVHVVDDLTYEVIALYEDHTLEEIIKELSSWDEKDVKESYVILTPPARSNPSSILLARPIFFFVIPLVVINAPNTHKAISKISPAIYLPLLLRFFILRLPF